ncbi:MAG TPA: oligosaccharide flippase family protein [Usitatibacter sp.]|nr:oligosaccharide flippase family protein [Usitatibacter sp.]
MSALPAAAGPAPRTGRMLARLLRQSSHYTIGSLLVTAASLVSFPVFTRTFSAADYGALNLIGSLLLFWTGVGKLGIQNSIVRFHAEARAGKGLVDESRYVSTVLVGMTLTGLAATAGWAIAALAVPTAWWRNDQVARLLLPLTALVLVRVLDSAASNLLRAEQRSIAFNVYAVARKYLSIGAIVVLVFWFVPGLDGFFLGTFVVEAAALAVVLALLLRENRVTALGFSASAFREMALFGVPMIALELAGIVLILGDRYVIQALLGAESLGYYSAAYNLSQYVEMVIFLSFTQALAPIYMRIWEDQGEEATRRFLDRALRLYLMIAAAVLAGMVAVGADVLTTLASDRYAQGAVVIPLVVAAMCIDGAIPIFAAGIYIHKRNHALVPYVVAAAVANVGLNLLLVPRVGLIGASVATLTCYVFLGAAAWRLGSKRLHIAFPFGELAKFAALAGLMFLAVREVSAPVAAVQLLLRIATGIAVYAALLLAFDRPSREALVALRARLATRAAP